MTSALERIEQYFQERAIRYRRTDDAIEVSFYGYPIAERYRIVYLERADAVLVSSHGIAYPRLSQEERVLRAVLTWNHEAIGACWSYDQETRGICADTTLYLAGEPLSLAQFDRHFNGLVTQVRRRLPDLLRLIVEEPESALDPAVKAQLETILQQQEQTDDDRGEDGSETARDGSDPPGPSAEH
ncbi:MAG: hypothetical protein RMM58_11205 [Chloroflexota bacterium]|nr:hypothetical protein [Dehalococcoidia bacterium]MDW8254431.1 hypothetical protein [Chloroflexota bacterium]